MGRKDLGTNCPKVGYFSISFFYLLKTPSITSAFSSPLVQFTHLLRLGEARRKRLSSMATALCFWYLGGMKEISTAGVKENCFLSTIFMQIRDQLGQRDIPMHLAVIHSIASFSDLRGAFSCVPVILAVSAPLVLHDLHLLFQRSGAKFSPGAASYRPSWQGWPRHRSCCGQYRAY